MWFLVSSASCTPFFAGAVFGLVSDAIICGRNFKRNFAAGALASSSRGEVSKSIAQECT